MESVLIVSIAFSPNIGGIETHFDDLISELSKKIKVYVLTYMPITTNVSAPLVEHRGKNITIVRVPWFKGFFYKLVKHPAVEFAILFPGLFVALPLVLLFKSKEIQVIHSHGLVAGAVCVIWGKVFRKKVITTTHSIYNFPRRGVYTKFARAIFNGSDNVLTLSKQSKNEIKNLGVSTPVSVFTYWVDQNTFKPIPEAKKSLNWRGFNVLFVGRLIEEKGVNVLIKSAMSWNPKVCLRIVGVGPLEQKLRDTTKKSKNIQIVGAVKNSELPLYYSAADILVVPSIHEEGFGRVILESLSCGTPVIGSKRGAIPEAMTAAVGELIKINEHNIAVAVAKYNKDSKLLKEKAKNAVVFAKHKYSKSNLGVILRAYEK